MPKWEAVHFGKFKKQCEHKIAFGLTNALGAYHCDLQKHKETYCASKVCPIYTKDDSLNIPSLYTYGISKNTGCVVKFPIRVTGWLHNSEWFLLDHYPSEKEYYELMPECVKTELPK